MSDMREACGMPITRSAVQDTYLGVGIPGSEASGASGGGGGGGGCPREGEWERAPRHAPVGARPYVRGE